MGIKYIIYFFIALLFSACSSLKNTEDAGKADVVVYGGTSAGVVAAVKAAKEGKSVVLIAPENQLGALSSSGLGFTDAGKAYVIGGMSREFYHRVWKEYAKPENWKFQKRSDYAGMKSQGSKSPAMDDDGQLMWIFEPRVAEKVFEDWLKEHKNIKLYRGEFLDREGGLLKGGAKILSIKTLSGKRFEGKIFIDASFEGDLMAAAGCEYAVGREGNSKYGEKYNGYRNTLEHNYHNFKTKVSPYKIPGDKSSALLKHVSISPLLPNGAPDDKVQAYCYRMCLSDVPENRVAIEKPEGYSPEDYEIFARFIQSDPTTFPFIMSKIPNRKTDTNNARAVSTDYIGMNYSYPEASYQERAKIAEAHKNYQLGLLYFIQTDPRIPQKLRDRMKNYGLAKDEFLKTGNWPFYLYIREARRLVGEYVMTEHDCMNEVETPKPVGMGSYTLDSHNTSRFVDADGFIQNEGDVQVRLKEPYKISYGSIVPKKSQCSNLLVPVACSASHIAYGSIRMEPVFMILGQSAATAAALAIDGNLAVQDVDYGALAAKLKRDGQILSDPRKK